MTLNRFNNLFLKSLPALAVAAWGAVAVVAEAGTLVIVGGGLSSTNDAVFESFIDALPNPQTDTIAVIAAASAEPVRAAERFTEDLADFGVAPSRLVPIALALRDDPATPDVDESSWAGNGSSLEEAARLEEVGGIWFTGGDQRRLSEVLLDENGQPTVMLTTMLERLASGAVIGGTSAGAAVMSDPMITGGDSLTALLDRGADKAGETLRLDTGLGFLDHAVVDQHFGERARLGRLAVALAGAPADRRLGIGIDEDTAVVVDVATAEARVVGYGDVTVLDARSAELSSGTERFAGENLKLSVFSAGDHFSLSGPQAIIDASRQRTVGNEYFSRPPRNGGGMALPPERLSRLLGTELLDNAEAEVLNRMSFDGTAGVLFQFRQTAASEGYWGRDRFGREQYSITELEFSIIPISVKAELPALR
ncbi:MAG: cyanophycinase [Pseudomonadota bacterium]